MNTMIRERNTYATQFYEAAARLPGYGLAWLDRLRARGMDHFVDLGFPTTRMEEWKFTNVAPISRTTFEASPDPSNASIPETLRPQLELFPTPTLVFTNGIFDERNSSRRQSSYAAADLCVAGLSDS